jgi:hypothetical protein
MARQPEEILDSYWETNEFAGDDNFWMTLRQACAKSKGLQERNVTMAMMVEIVETTDGHQLPNPRLRAYNDYRVLQYFQNIPEGRSWDMGTDFLIDLRTMLMAEWSPSVTNPTVVPNATVRGLAFRWLCRRAQHKAKSMWLARAQMAEVVEELDTKLAAALPERAEQLAGDKTIRM